MRKRCRDRVTSGVIQEALAKGDAVIVRLVDHAVWGLGIALVNTQNLLDLEAIIFGGGLGDRLGSPFVTRIEDHAMKHLRLPDRPPKFLTTELGDLQAS